MRIFINASTCVIGGGVQVAACFINYLYSQRREFSKSWSFALSEQVANECDVAFLSDLKSEGRLITTSASPGSPIRGRATRNAVTNAFIASHCDRVFTIFGPSYVRFSVPEYMGFADAFAFSPTSEAYKWHPWASRISSRLRKMLKMRWASGAKRYWVESPFAKTALAQTLGVSKDIITVIPNCVNSKILEQHVQPQEPVIPTFFFLAAAYWHKNHMILPDVLRALRSLRPGVRLRITTTLPFDSPLWLMLSDKLRLAGVSDMVYNFGPLRLSEVAKQLSSSTAVIQISLLETFSSTYLEAMAYGVPLLVADRAYARDVCGNSALYANPLDAEDIALKILKLIDDYLLRKKLSAEGFSQIAKFPQPDAKNNMLFEFCTQ